MKHPCETCPNPRCYLHKECPDWAQWFCEAWDGLGQKKAARVDRREQPEEDKPISHREYVFGHILTAGWRDVK